MSQYQFSRPILDGTGHFKCVEFGWELNQTDEPTEALRLLFERHVIDFGSDHSIQLPKRD
jgi:hypothetical protein